MLKVRVSALERIAHELRYAPAATARRQVERAEKLAEIVEADGTYPEDFIVFQITGYRPDIKEPALVPGRALLQDLAGLIDRLSIGAKYQPDELKSPAWLTMEDLCARWGVSRKSLERLRPKGLIGRRVQLGHGRARTVFSAKMVERIAKREGMEAKKPAKPRRMSAAELAEATRRAGRLQTAGASRSTAAQRIAKKLGRSHEAVRQALARHDRDAAQPIFSRKSKSAATVHRMGVRELAEKCRAVRLAIPAETLELVHGKEPKWLADERARTGLGAPGTPSLPEHVADALRAGWPDQHVERARAMAYWALISRAKTMAAALHRTRPAALAVDRIITDLRWASYLKTELIRGEQLLLLRTIEVQTGKPLLDLPAAEGVTLLRSCLAAIAHAVDRHDPAKGGRLAAPAGIEMSKVVSHWVSEHRAAEGGRERARVISANAPLTDWTLTVASWQSWTEPPAAVRAGLAGVDEATRFLLLQRHGWGGRAPMSVDELAKALRKPATVVSRLIHTAERTAARHSAKA